MSSMIIEHSKEHPNTVINITRGLFVIKEIPQKIKNDEQAKDSLKVFQRKVRFYPPRFTYINNSYTKHRNYQQLCNTNKRQISSH